MKHAVLLLLSTFLILSIATVAWSLPYTGADITQKGTDYSAIEKLGSTPVSGDNAWYEEGDSIWTAWDDVWVEYTADLTVGTWNIGLNAINHGLLNENLYAQFRISNSLTTQTFTVPASETEEFSGYVQTAISTEDTYTIRYTWLNDANGPGWDANIEITSVFFDDINTAPVPEPATMMLFGIGLLGLAGVSRRKK